MHAASKHGTPSLTLLPELLGPASNYLVVTDVCRVCMLGMYVLYGIVWYGVV